MTVLRFLFLLLFFNLSANFLWAQGNGPEPKNKFEELFIWKVSDELKLPTSEEKKFSDILRELNKKKSELSKKQDEMINQMAGKKIVDPKVSLGKYKKVLDDYNQLQTREFEELKKILGDERMAKYLVIKRDLTNKVKSLLIEKGEKKEAELPAPKVIEE